MTRFITLPVLLLAVGCTADDGSYPRLLPTQQILAEPSLPDHAGGVTDDASDSLRARGAATRAKADAIPDRVDDSALQARANALRRKADALRQTDSECPPGSENCPEPPQP